MWSTSHSREGTAITAQPAAAGAPNLVRVRITARARAAVGGRVRMGVRIGVGVGVGVRVGDGAGCAEPARHDGGSGGEDGAVYRVGMVEEGGDGDE